MSKRYESDSSESSEEEKPKKRVRKVVKKEEPVKEAPEKAPTEPSEKKVYQRLAAEKRLEIISLKERGIEDPEYQATRSAAGRWTVKKRKFPIDQSPHLDTTAGTMQVPPTPVRPVFNQPVAPVAQPVPEPVKKDNLDLNWINTQAMVNDSLKRDLEVLSEKYDKLAQKEEKRKRAKAKIVPPPPSMPVAPQPTQAPVQPQRRPGLYQRAGKLSINQFG
jgi:hypothetical protein